MKTTRRAALQGAAAAGLATLAMPSIARAAAGSVVVIGAGFGGATAARYLKAASPRSTSPWSSAKRASSPARSPTA